MVRRHQRMDWQSALHEHQASPGSCDLEKRGASTPEWPSTAGMTRTTKTKITKQKKKKKKKYIYIYIYIYI